MFICPRSCDAGAFLVMSKAVFVFLSVVLMLLPLILMVEDFTIQKQLIFCAPFILILGIPHGAIDNHLFQKENQIRTSRFIGIYLGVVGLYVLVWLISPVTAYLLFLVLSAYHFGQSQFSHYFKSQSKLKAVLYTIWGVSLIAGLIHLNINEITSLTGEFAEFSMLQSFHDPLLFEMLFTGSLVSLVVTWIVFISYKQLSIQQVAMEALVLTLLLVSFFVTPLLIGFTLYFIILHAFQVMQEEYRYLCLHRRVNNMVQFIKLLLPLTISSILGILLLLVMVHFGLFDWSYGYVLLVSISAITAPHVYVMNRFYAFFKG